MARKFATNLDMGLNQVLNMLFQVLSAAPSSPAEGQVYYDSTKLQVGVYSGSAWQYYLLTVPGATSSALGTIELTGDLGGTDTAPTVVNLHLAGTTSIGQRLTNVTTPVNGGDAATKDYVDSAIFGLKPCGVDYATAAALATYTGTGTGTLTATANATLAVDGQNPTVGQRILVKNQASALNIDNGIYVVSATGSGSAKWVLTYALDAESDALTWTDLVGQLVAVANEGNTLGDTIWMSSVAPGGTLGTTAVAYVQIQSGLSLTGDNVYTVKSGSEIVLELAADITPPGNGLVATITTGGGHVVKTCLTGNGTLTSFTITHNLGTYAYDVIGQQNNSGVPGAPVELDWAPGTTNTVVITFPVAPANAVSYFVTLVG